MVNIQLETIMTPPAEEQSGVPRAGSNMESLTRENQTALPTYTNI